ncbi:MAG: hypothetical protein ACN6NZ_02480 [Burkholderiales bacterium]
MTKPLIIIGLLSLTAFAHAQPLRPDDYKAAEVKRAESQASTPNMAVGKLHLYKRNSDSACASLNIEYRKEAAYMGNYNCGNDQVYSFKVSNASKGNTIKLGSDRPVKESDYSYCPENDWRFVLEVTDDAVDTSKISISDLRNIENGQMVATGLKMQKKHYRSGIIAGKLSCVDTNNR